MSKRIPLSPAKHGKYAIVDDEDFEWLSKWKWMARTAEYSNTWYAYRLGQPRCFIHMHREITKAPVDMDVDHINGDGLDNQRHNLRVCTHKQNNRNNRRYSSNTSGYKGVYIDSNDGMYVAQISPNGRKIHLGRFDSPEQAADVYDQAAIKYFGEYASLNNVVLSDDDKRQIQERLDDLEHGIRKNNRSGYRGVSFDKSRNKWAAEITVDWKKMHLGRFNTANEAAIAYNQAAIKYRGESAILNDVN